MLGQRAQAAVFTLFFGITRDMSLRPDPMARGELRVPQPRTSPRIVSTNLLPIIEWVQQVGEAKSFSNANSSSLRPEADLILRSLPVDSRTTTAESLGLVSSISSRASLHSEFSSSSGRT